MQLTTLPAMWEKIAARAACTAARLAGRRRWGRAPYGQPAPLPVSAAHGPAGSAAVLCAGQRGCPRCVAFAGIFAARQIYFGIGHRRDVRGAPDPRRAHTGSTQTRLGGAGLGGLASVVKRDVGAARKTGAEGPSGNRRPGQRRTRSQRCAVSVRAQLEARDRGWNEVRQAWNQRSAKREKPKRGSFAMTLFSPIWRLAQLRHRRAF